MLRVTEKVVVITGGAGALGHAIARRILAEGGRVALADLSPARLTAVAEGLPADRLATFVTDTTNEGEVEALGRSVVEAFGRVDGWVNAAGITRDSTMRRMRVEDFVEVIQVNLLGTWLGTKVAANLMRDQVGGGSIVNLSSISGKVGNIGQTNYSASKSAIVGLTKAAAKELGHIGIRVNAIRPGLIMSPMIEQMPQQIVQERIAETPLGRLGEPDEVANVVLFLISDWSSYITGAVIDVSGGRHM